MENIVQILSVIIVILLNPFEIMGVEKKEDNLKPLIKRNVLILPFLNKNNIEKYSYISDTLINALKANLIKTDKFNIKNSTQIDKTIEKKSYKKDYIVKRYNAVKFAKGLESDIVVIGTYIIFEDKIMVQIEAIDVFTSQTIAITNMEGEIGIDLLRIIDESSQDITEKMLKNINNEKFIRTNKDSKYTIAKNSGIAITIIGSGLFLTGSALLIYDLAGYSNTLLSYKNNYENTHEDFDMYLNSYKIFIGLFIGSIATLSTGVVLMGIGIPLIIINNKKEKLSLNLEISNEISLVLSYKF